MTEFEKMKRWRERNFGEGLAGRVKLAELTGYAPETLYWFERGINPPRGGKRTQTPIADWVWQRFKRACQGVQAEFDGKRFGW